MDEFEEISQKVVKFRNERDWKQFHNAKDCSLSLVLEATELLEHFQWKNGDEIEHKIKSHKEEISDELADVLYWLILLSHDLDIDLLNALSNKIQKNEQKYPVAKAKGSSKKYNEL